MHRYDNVKYNGFNLSEVCDIEEIRLPILPSNKISTLDIASRDGEIYKRITRNLIPASTELS